MRPGLVTSVFAFAAESSSQPDTAKLLQLVLGIAINCEQKESKSHNYCVVDSALLITLFSHCSLFRAICFGPYSSTLLCMQHFPSSPPKCACIACWNYTVEPLYYGHPWDQLQCPDYWGCPHFRGHSTHSYELGPKSDVLISEVSLFQGS